MMNIKVNLPSGSRLFDLEDKIPFGCKAAACGRCRIQIVAGDENISPETIKETRAKKILRIDGDDMRLACQIQSFGQFEFKLVSQI